MEKVIHKQRRFFILKIDFPALFAIILFAGLIFLYMIPGFEKVMMERKRILIHEMTSSAYSLLNYYHSLEKEGKLERSEAQELAKSAISSIRYGETLKDYFWITDTHPNMVVHPYRPELNGTDLTNYRDSKGKTIFVEFVRAVSSGGESYVDYMWQWNDDSTRIVPKLSFVKLFEPWKWVVGTGIYIEDVRSEIRRMENRALFISGIIGAVIIVLLVLISRQSHRIEAKRNRAEEELQRSREMYRTLAEAASEGVMIWSVQGMQANKTILSWLGYTEEEFGRMSLNEIMSSGELPEFNDPSLLYEDLSARRYVECVLKMKNGSFLSSHADFSRILMGEVKAVLIVVRPVKSIRSQTDFHTKPELVDLIGTGFIRISYGRRNRFLFATRPAFELLGFKTFQDIISHSVESFFVNPLQLKSIRSALAAGSNIFNREVLLRRVDGQKFWAIINLVIIESDSKEIWCEGTIESLGASALQPDIPVAGLPEYGASFIMNAPVNSFMRQPVRCMESLPVNRGIALMKEHQTDCLVIVNQKGESMGVIHSSEIGFRLAEGGSPSTEIFRWMISPPGYINENAPMADAFEMIHNSREKCLLVTNGNKDVTGMITYDELSGAFFTAPGLIVSAISSASSSKTLHRIYQDSCRIAVSMILGHADPFSVSVYLSGVADAVCERVIALCIEEMGLPPCSFAFFQTGSAGRREQTFSTDQDNAIIFENLKGEQLENAGKYFVTLGKKINEMLSVAGFRLCRGGNMAGNPEWCQPIERWKKYFSDWIRTPGPDELLAISIFFDFRFCYGDSSLTDELRRHINTSLKTNDIFFHHMTAAWKQFNPAPAILAEKSVDLKRLLMPLTGIIRLYTLKHGITEYSTIERMAALYSGRHLEQHLFRDILKAWKDITSIRLSRQAASVSKGEEPGNTVDFDLLNADLRQFAENAIPAINNLMLKAGNEFYTDTI